MYTKRSFQSLVRFCEANDAEIRTDYSGRGMFGSSCIAVVCDPYGPVPAYLARTKAGKGRVDGMGRDRVVHYWPSIKIDSIPGGAEIVAAMKQEE